MTDKSFGIDLSREKASERSFMSQVYLWMALGLAITGVVAMTLAANPSAVVALMKNGFLLIAIMIAQFGIVFWLSAAIGRMSAMTATIGFSVYATLNGIIFSTLFLVYTGASIASAFITTAGTFAVVSFFGFVTKKDLTNIGGFLFMALIGLIIASVVNLFLRSSAFDLALSYIGVFIFIGLTAYDTQQLKRIHEQGISAGEALQKLSLMGALKLYLDFINLFLFLLRIMGRRRD